MSRTRWVVAALLAACLLGACDDDDPKPDIPDPTSSTGSTSASVSTSPTDPSTPAAGNPIATIKRWITAQNKALRTGDTSGLRALASDDCNGCSEFPDAIEGVFRAGGHFDGGEWTYVRGKVDDPSAVPLRVNVGVRIAGGSTVASAGAEPTKYGPTSRLLVFELTDTSGQWLISLIGSLS
jgi:hypothetical protein